MLIADVNVFVLAHRASAPDHSSMRAWLRSAINGDEAFGVSESTLASVVRIVTNWRVFEDASDPGVALDFCAAMRTAPASTIVAPGARHWTIFAGLVRDLRLRAGDVPDAYLAALALENGAMFVTRDRGFARFPGLRLLDPLQPSSRGLARAGTMKP